MSATHTPGPWIIDRHSEKSIRELHVYSEAHYQNVGICIIDLSRHPEIQSEYQANARLIAAAPELMALAQHIVSLARNARSEEDERLALYTITDAARAAIAKATEGTP